MSLSLSCRIVSRTGSALRQRSPRRDPLDRLPSDRGDAVEVLVVVPDDGSFQLGDRGDEQVRDPHAAMVECLLVREPSLYVEGSLPGFVAARKLVEGA